MPTKLVTPEEWYRLTGERGSVYIETPPKRRRKQKSFGLVAMPMRMTEDPGTPDAWEDRNDD
jgi:hypothetical protein